MNPMPWIFVHCKRCRNKTSWTFRIDVDALSDKVYYFECDLCEKKIRLWGMTEVHKGLPV
jgi:hypothetical protein